MDDRNIVDLYLQRDEKAIKETQTKYGSYCYTIANLREYMKVKKIT